jgi:hypothetical protein
MLSFSVIACLMFEESCWVVGLFSCSFLQKIPAGLKDWTGRQLPVRFTSMEEGSPFCALLIIL